MQETPSTKYLSPLPPTPIPRRRFLACSAGLTLALITSVCGTFTTHSAEAAKTPDGKLALRIIYFGQPNSARQKDFVSFLGKHFDKVSAGDLNAFAPKDAAGYDVVLLDYDEVKVVGNTIQMPKTPLLENYSRPTLTLGATGALMCDRWRLKTGYL